MSECDCKPPPLPNAPIQPLFHVHFPCPFSKPSATRCQPPSRCATRSHRRHASPQLTHPPRRFAAPLRSTRFAPLSTPLPACQRCAIFISVPAYDFSPCRFPRPSPSRSSISLIHLGFPLFFLCTKTLSQLIETILTFHPLRSP